MLMTLGYAFLISRAAMGGYYVVGMVVQMV
jgi:hypothetical protein